MHPVPTLAPGCIQRPGSLHNIVKSPEVGFDTPPPPIYLPLHFPGGSSGKESAPNAGDLDLIPGLGRSPGEGKGYPLQYSGLKNSMDSIVHGVPKSQTRLSHTHTSTSPWVGGWSGFLPPTDGDPGPPIQRYSMQSLGFFLPL